MLKIPRFNVMFLLDCRHKLGRDYMLIGRVSMRECVTRSRRRKTNQDKTISMWLRLGLHQNCDLSLTRKFYKIVNPHGCFFMLHFTYREIEMSTQQYSTRHIINLTQTASESNPVYHFRVRPCLAHDPICRPRLPRRFGHELCRPGQHRRVTYGEFALQAVDGVV